MLIDETLVANYFYTESQKDYYLECNYVTNTFNYHETLTFRFLEGTLFRYQRDEIIEPEDLEKEYPNWEIQKYSSNEIILYREFDSNCGQHFILRNDNGKITIYKINEEMQEEVYEKTEISVEYLSETDKGKISEGIKVNGIEELNQLLEDFE